VEEESQDVPYVIPVIYPNPNEMPKTHLPILCHLTTFIAITKQKNKLDLQLKPLDIPASYSDPLLPPKPPPHLTRPRQPIQQPTGTPSPARPSRNWESNRKVLMPFLEGTPGLFMGLELYTAARDSLGCAAAACMFLRLGPGYLCFGQIELMMWRRLGRKERIRI